MSAPAGSSASGRLRGWAFPQTPLARVARVRAAIYAIVIIDVLFFVTDPIDHGDVPAALYRELPVRALLHLPQPSPAYGWVLLVVILASAAVAASGRLPRLAGWVCAVAMLDWVSNGMSYGKVDHDHFALVVALFVLPTVGRAGWSEGRRSEAEQRSQDDRGARTGEARRHGTSVESVPKPQARRVLGEEGAIYNSRSPPVNSRACPPRPTGSRTRSRVAACSPSACAPAASSCPPRPSPTVSS